MKMNLQSMVYQGGNQLSTKDVFEKIEDNLKKRYPGYFSRGYIWIGTGTTKKDIEAYKKEKIKYKEFVGVQAVDAENNLIKGALAFLVKK